MTSFWDNLPQPFFILAPMEAVTDVVFRHVVKQAGAPDVFFTEFANATGWVHAGDKAIAGRLIKTDDEHPLVAQIWGGEAGDMEQFAAHCMELGFDGIDINMGCPAKSAIKSGGAALIRQPDVAVAAITAAKTAGLPVSVKTRLGYTYIDEWREWLSTLLAQNLANLTVHLRTKKEMSKVPAHYELIDDIIKLRDEIAPQTLLTINGDIRNRTHGLELVRQHPGINGIMIGRGIFSDPFCFACTGARTSHKTIRDPLKPSETPLAPDAPAPAAPPALECALEETAGSRTAAATPPSSARAHSSLKSSPEIFRERSAETSVTHERFTVSGRGGVAPAAPILYSGNLFLDPQIRVGVYEQEINERYLADPLEAAIEKLYLSRDLPISETKIRQLLADYLFTEADRMTPLARLSGGQKARFQIIAMLANDPQLLILDEPTNHLDLPSIEELEMALAKYSGAILYVSHDNYFRREIGGEVVQIGAA